MGTKEKILNKALKLFAQHGYAETSINIIVREVGITKGGFYYFFRSKEDLFKECVERYFLSYIDQILEYSKKLEGSPLDRLQKIMKISLRQTENMIEDLESTEINFKTYYVLLLESLKEFTFVKEKTAHFYRQIIELLEQILNQGKQENEIRKDVDVQTVAFEFTAASEGAILLWLIDEQIDLAKMQEKVYKRIVHSIIK